MVHVVPQGGTRGTPQSKGPWGRWGSASRLWSHVAPRIFLDGSTSSPTTRRRNAKAATVVAVRLVVAATVAVAVTALLVLQLRTTTNIGGPSIWNLSEGRRIVEDTQGGGGPNKDKENDVPHLRSASSGSHIADMSLSHSQPSPFPSCPYMSLKDLAPDERHPRANSTSRPHIVDPPPIDEPLGGGGGLSSSSSSLGTTLVCCHTTAGPISIAAHRAWAPHGAQRFVDMVKSNYFSTSIAALRPDSLVVPLMRCVSEFLCQFGLRGNASNLYATKIPDDPQWLPSGPEGRRNSAGVKRFQKGYLAYAGSGPRSRGRQLFVSLAQQSGLGGSGSPWEVPWGEVVGPHSFETLDTIYTGYGENGPSQESLMTDAGLVEARAQFPQLDWITSCHVVDEDANIQDGDKVVSST